MRILLIDDDADELALIRHMLSDAPISNIELQWAPDYEAGLDKICHGRFDVCLLDYRLDYRNGLELLEEMRRKGCDTPVILLTGQGDYGIDLQAMRAGATDYLVKGKIDASLLERSIRYAMERGQKEEELQKYRERLEQLVEERTRELELTVLSLEREIAGRKQAEDALRSSEQRFRLLYEEAPVGYQSLDENGCLLEVNPAWLRLLGYSKEEVIGRWFGDFLAPECVEHFRNSFPIFKSMGEVSGSGFDIIRKDGSRMSVQFDVKVSKDVHGRFKQTHSILRDITEAKQAGEAIQALVKSTVGTVGSDFFDEVVIRICEWLDCDCAIIGEIVDDTTVNALSMQLDGSLIHELSYQLRGAPCERTAHGSFTVYPEGLCSLFPEAGFFLNMHAKSYVGSPLLNRAGKAVGLLCAVSRRKLSLPARTEEVMSIIAAKASSEIERKRIEEEKARIENQLRQAQKMEAIGTLAGGIAHDFNNILAPIIGYTEMTLNDVPQSSPMHYDLKQVLKAAHRARDLVRQILSFSRHRKEQQRTPVNISTIVKEALKLLRASLPSSIEIRQDVQEGMALADATQIHQVLINLCTNAAHAMGGSGMLDVSLKEVALSSNDLSSLSMSTMDLNPGSYLKLSVSDTGHGMDASTMQRIFDPYFTTKEVGKGSGLGLSVVHGIVKRHEGMIGVRSEPGKGSTFHVYIPKIESKPDKTGKVRPALPKGTEHVLIIDDEQMVADIGVIMLEHLGYKVTAKTSALEALDVFRAKPEEFDLIITDYTMPHMNGIDLARELLLLRPDIPVILCTGFSEKVTDKTAKDAGIRGFAMKPLDRMQFAELVRSTLDNKKG
jgi:PAS domain S-box-containing protein